MKRETFFEYVLSGRIGLDKTDKNIVDSDIIVNICDTKKKSDLGEIKANRLAVFSEKNILELLLSDPVIDFDDSDKIFFKLHIDIEFTPSVKLLLKRKSMWFKQRILNSYSMC